MRLADPTCPPYTDGMPRATRSTERPQGKDRRRVPRPAIGLVLSGGGARGYAHIGMLRVLERHGVEPDVMAGTSMGAILAALYAYGYRADDLYEMAAAIPWRNELELSLVAGVMKSDKLHDLLRTYLPATFEELGKPLAVTCTDLEAGEALVFTEGELIPAIRASACYPGAFEPVSFGGRTLVDGGILNNLPVDALALMRARMTLASDVSPPRRASYADAGEERHGWWQRMVATVTLERRAPLSAVSLRAADIMMRLLTDAQYVHHPADLRVLHQMPEIRVDSFHALEEAVAHGEVNTEAALRADPDLLARLQSASGPAMKRRPLPRPEVTTAPDARDAPPARGRANGAWPSAPVAAEPRPRYAGDGEGGTAAPTAAEAARDAASAASRAAPETGAGLPGPAPTPPLADEIEARGENPVRALWSHLRRG
jgi:NTE family protein